MNFNLNVLNLSQKVNLSKRMPKQGEITLEKPNQIDDFLKGLIKKIKDSVTSEEADAILQEASKNSEELEMLNYTTFKHKDYNIISCFTNIGEPIINNLKILEKLNLSCVPKLIGAVKKDDSVYIITKHAGTQDGNLKLLFLGGKERVPKEAKLTAYKEMQKLTNAGFVDSQNLRSSSWFYTPDNKIFLPNWNGLRQIRPDESPKDIVEQYYNILFRK